MCVAIDGFRLKLTWYKIIRNPFCVSWNSKNVYFTCFWFRVKSHETSQMFFPIVSILCRMTGDFYFQKKRNAIKFRSFFFVQTLNINRREIKNIRTNLKIVHVNEASNIPPDFWNSKQFVFLSLSLSMFSWFCEALIVSFVLVSCTQYISYTSCFVLINITLT